MKQVFKINEDGTFNFSESIVIKPYEQIPEGYGVPDVDKHYKDDGTEITAEELEEIRNRPVPKTAEQLLGEQLVQKDLEMMQLKQQTKTLGQENVQKDFKIMSLESTNKSLGEQIVGLDLRLLQGGM